MHDVGSVLKERGLLGFSDDPDFLKEMATRPVTLYNGYDPSGPSLHVGHFITIMGLVHFQRAGHKPIALLGGGTGLIGDPSGKSEERTLLTLDLVGENKEKIKGQISRLLDFNCGDNSAVFVDNLDWIGKLSFVDFLRDVGKHFRVNEMIHKESVKKRMESDEGISLTEFCYQTLQSYDFYQLYKQYGCELQTGGMDQWGNIAAGIDLVRRLAGKRVHGVCFPLLTKADGTKFGKTESGGVWLNPDMTSPFDFYQFWVRADDADVVKFLRFFTLFDSSQIAQLESALAEAPEQREAQKALAHEVTRAVHGRTEADLAKAAAEKLFSGDLKGATDDQLKTIFPDVPSTKLPRARLTAGLSLIDLLAESGLCKSKGDARRQIQSGGIYINDERCNQVDKALSTDDLASEHYLILRRGKKTYHLIAFD